MLEDTHGELTDKNTLLLGAGFVFGVAFAMFVLALATAAVAGLGTLLGSALAVTTAAGILFAGLIGLSLYTLSFPENRLDLPVERIVRRYAGRFVDTKRRHDDTRTERL